MSAAITCASCNRPLRVPASALGQTVQCPLCLDEFTAEADPAAEAAAHAAEPPARRTAPKPELVVAHVAAEEPPVAEAAEEPPVWVEPVAPPPRAGRPGAAAQFLRLSRPGHPRPRPRPARPHGRRTDRRRPAPAQAAAATCLRRRRRPGPLPRRQPPRRHRRGPRRRVGHRPSVDLHVPPGQGRGRLPQRPARLPRPPGLPHPVVSLQPAGAVRRAAVRGRAVRPVHRRLPGRLPVVPHRRRAGRRQRGRGDAAPVDAAPAGSGPADCSAWARPST